jgi:hypothetical protein
MQHNDLLGVLVAAFPNRACAEEATRELHHAGVRHTWLGVTKSDDNPLLRSAGIGGGHERVEALGITHVVARWLHREHDETLYDALREHGVAEAEARRLDGAVADGNCVLVAEDVLDTARALSIAGRHGGTPLVAPEELEYSAYGTPSDPMVETRAEAARRHPPRNRAVPGLAMTDQ